MESLPEADADIIEDFEAIRLMINIYLIKKVKSLNKPINQERFIDNVRKEFRNRGFTYMQKRILYTWKYLLDSYQYYKAQFSNEESRKAWPYFDLMDNCFDDSTPTAEKFQDSRWTFFLIQSLKKHKRVVLHHGLNMDILEAVEDDFREENNYEINQKDIYNQWVFLKRFFRQNQKTGYYRQLTKNHAYFTVLKQFFEKDSEDVSNENDSELLSAIESIKEDKVKKRRRRKTDPISTSQDNNVPSTNFAADGSTMPFTVVMHDILLQFIKRNKAKIHGNNGVMDENTVNEALEEFQSLGYNLTKQSISNEWNDLSCRYELIKNTEHPEKWPYFSDMNSIYMKDDANKALNSADNQDDNQSTIGSIIIENLRKNQSLKQSDYAELTERLLNVYEANSKEFLEIKDILVERNLLREETNYLLNSFVEKFSKSSDNLI